MLAERDLALSPAQIVKGGSPIKRLYSEVRSFVSELLGERSVRARQNGMTVEVVDDDVEQLSTIFANISEGEVFRIQLGNLRWLQCEDELRC